MAMQLWIENGRAFNLDDLQENLPDSKAAKEIDRLLAIERRFKAMLPLFEEARDALPAIPMHAAKLHGIDPKLADRMDDVGIKERWEAQDAQGEA